MDLARCETHDETFPLGQVCRFHGREHEAWLVYAEEADQQRVRAVRAEAERDELRAAVEAASKLPDRWLDRRDQLTRNGRSAGGAALALEDAARDLRAALTNEGSMTR